MTKKLIAIYSVGIDREGNEKGIDELYEKGANGIYIYDNSLNDLEKIEEGDIICLIRTSLQKITLFEFNKKEDNYIYLPTKKENIFEFNNVSIGDFKNLYFLNFDNLKSWVRSPLATEKNILIFSTDNEILEDYKDIDKLKEVFGNINEYKRKYIIGDINKLEDKTNIYLNFKDLIFGKEYSIFYEEGIKNELTNKNIKQILNEVENGNSLKILDYLISSNEYTVNSYTGYYDLTRLLKSYDKEKDDEEKDEKIEKITKIDAIKKLLEDSNGTANLEYIYENIKKYHPNITNKGKDWKAALRGSLYREIGSSIEKKGDLYSLIDINEKKEKVLKKVDINIEKKSVKDFIKNKEDDLEKKYKKYKQYFNIGIINIIVLNILLLIFTLFNNNSNDFISNFLSFGFYIFTIEFLILYISYFYFSLSNKYLEIKEIYNSYTLLSELEEWASLEIDDIEFKKENIRKLLEIQNVVESSFKKNNDKMPTLEMIDYLSKIKNLNK